MSFSCPSRVLQACDFNRSADKSIGNEVNITLGSIAHVVCIGLPWLRDATRIDGCDIDGVGKTYRPEFRERQGQWEWTVFREGEGRPVLPWSRPYSAKASAKADAEKAIRRLQARDTARPETLTNQH